MGIPSNTIMLFSYLLRDNTHVVSYNFSRVFLPFVFTIFGEVDNCLEKSQYICSQCEYFGVKVV